MPVPSTVDISAVGDGNPPVRQLVADFVSREVAPIVADLDAHSRFPAELYRAMAKLDLFGITVFVVDLDLPGVERTYKERKMGQRASQVGGLRFSSVALPASALLGDEGAGFRYMTGVLAKGRLGIAGLSLGISRAALTVAIA